MKWHQYHHDGKITFYFYCPGCKHAHGIETPRWSFNGDVQNPSFSPSVRHFYRHPQTNKEHTTCHYHVRSGRVEFCGDCEHELRGKTVDISDFPEGYALP
jgi:hypothetical protein